MNKEELMQLAKIISDEMTPMLSKHWKDSPDCLGSAFTQIETLAETIENVFAEVECLEEMEALRTGQQQRNDWLFRIGA